MNWDAFEDFINGEDNIPKNIIFYNWNYLKEKLPNDTCILFDLLQKYVFSKCKIVYKEYE